MSVYLIQWISLIAIFSLAVISPGPDFIMAVKNSIVYSRRAGVFTALGFSLGILVHASYTMLGLAAIISQSVFIFNAIKLLGAVYLIYIGAQALRSKGAGRSAVEAALKSGGQHDNKRLGDFAAVTSGFLTNALNPKTTLFFLAVFTQIVNPHTPTAWQFAYAITCMAMVFMWFSAVALVLTQSHIRMAFLKFSKWLDRLCGAALIVLGFKIALSES